MSVRPTPTAISPALKPVIELETILQDMLVEHRKLTRHLDAQQLAMQNMRLKDMEAARNQQEASRFRIIGLENRRRTQVAQLARINQLSSEPKIPQLAQIYPQRRNQLMQLQNELRSAMREVADKSFIATKVASAVLGHLNTAMRIVAAAVGNGGLYNKRGVPRVDRRVGVMEAVG